MICFMGTASRIDTKIHHHSRVFVFEIVAMQQVGLTTVEVLAEIDGDLYCFARPH